MRIGIDIRTPDAPGGQQRYLWRLAGFLAGRGEEVEVLTLRSGGQREALPPGLRVHSLRGLSGTDLRARVRGLGLDVFFANPERADRYRGLPMHVLRPGYGTRQGVQNLRSLRNPWIRRTYQTARWTPWERWALRNEREWYHQTRPRPRVIAISQLMSDAIQRDYGLGEERIHQIHNGVDLLEFSPEHRARERESERARFGIPPGALCLLFVGHNFRRKGLPELVHAVAGLGADREGLCILVAGRGTGSGQRRRLNELVARLGVQRQVVFAGDVVPVARAYAAADALVFPSWHDAFGFVVLEAMASGLPVVTTRWAGAHEVVRSAQDGFVLPAPDDRDALQHALRALRDHELRTAMGRSARAQAEGFGEPANFAAVHDVVHLVGEGD